MKYSNEGIPNNISEILQNAEDFAVWFDNPQLDTGNFSFESEYIDFRANQINKNVDEETKTVLISTLLNDIERGGERARCWIPHHGIRGIYNKQLVEIAVCFMCGWFRGQILDERFEGTFPNETESESKIFFDKVFAEQNIESK